MEKYICDIIKLQELCREWQARLNLEEWNVAVGINRSADMHPDNCGQIDFEPETCTATISILDPIDWLNPVFPQDMEHTLVHELLHIRFAPFEPKDESSLEYILWHREINTLAGIMVRLKRNASDVK